MAKAIGPFGRDSQTPYWFSGSRVDVPAEPPSHRPWILMFIGPTRNTLYLLSPYSFINDRHGMCFRASFVFVLSILF